MNRVVMVLGHERCGQSQCAAGGRAINVIATDFGRVSQSKYPNYRRGAL